MERRGGEMSMGLEEKGRGEMGRGGVWNPLRHVLTTGLHQIDNNNHTVSYTPHMSS